MQFNKLTAPNLTTGQLINTASVGSDVGINNINAVHNSNFENLVILTNKTIIGGGLSDDNIKKASITSESTTLNTKISEQSVDMRIDTNTNGSGQFGIDRLLINDSIFVPNNNKVLNIDTYFNINVLLSPINESVAIEYIFTFSYSPVFVSTIATKFIRLKVLKGAGNIWNFAPEYPFAPVTIPTAGVVYYRIVGTMSGNDPATVFFKAGNHALATMN